MRYKITFSFDGSGFHGWEIQPGQKTVRQLMEKVLSFVIDQPHTAITASGRTDSGVHATEQVAHFDSQKPLVDLNKIMLRLNERFLSEGIDISSIEECTKFFHANQSVVGKTYEYRIKENSTDRDNTYIWNVNRTVNMARLEQVAKLLIGKKDYASFTPPPARPRRSFVKNVRNIDIIREDGLIKIRVHGNSFMRYMVRVMVSVMMNYEGGACNDKFVKHLFKVPQNPTRKDCLNIMAPAGGLYSYKVFY